MCERNCHGLTCTILSKKLNFVLATFAPKIGRKWCEEAQGSAAQQIKQILCKASLVFFEGGFLGIFEVFEVNKT